MNLVVWNIYIMSKNLIMCVLAHCFQLSLDVFPCKTCIVALILLCHPSLWISAGMYWSELSEMVVYPHYMQVGELYYAEISHIQWSRLVSDSFQHLMHVLVVNWTRIEQWQRSRNRKGTILLNIREVTIHIICLK
jgi:hypothetical protein